MRRTLHRHQNPAMRFRESTPTRLRFRYSGIGRVCAPQLIATNGRPAGVRTVAETTYLEAIRQALFEEMERDPEVLCLGEDIGKYGGAFKVTEGLQSRFGEKRVIDTPISEVAIVGAAAGAAHMGMRPVCEMQFIDFISCAYDMLTNYVATVWKALEAAEQLAREDSLSVEVLDLRSLLPMDDEAIVATVRKTNRVLVVHEDTRTGGVAGEITARINEQAFEWLDAPVLRVTAADVPLPYAPPLEDYVLPQTADIVKAVRRLAAY